MMADASPLWTARARHLRDSFDASFAEPAGALDAVDSREPAVLLVEAGGAVCAVRIRDCAGVVAAAEVTSVPARVPGFRGFTSAGGVVRAVYDLGLLIGCPSSAAIRPALVIATRHGVAFAVDTVLGIATADVDDAIGPQPTFIRAGDRAARLVALSAMVDGLLDDRRDDTSRRHSAT